jgi:hypothetical protein
MNDFSVDSAAGPALQENMLNAQLELDESPDSKERPKKTNAAHEEAADNVVCAECPLHGTTELGIAETAEKELTDALNKFAVAKRALIEATVWIAATEENQDQPDPNAIQAAREALREAKRAADADLAAWQMAKAKDPGAEARCQHKIDSARRTIDKLKIWKD